MPSLRTFLVLSRGSSLPTVWSHCTAGWWLGGGGRPELLPYLFAGTTCLYLGGCFLNDAFDAAYDREHRRNRPIPAGEIRHRTVLQWAWAWLALGMFLLFCAGKATGAIGAVLLLWILFYNLVHRALTLSPLVLAFCRFFVYLLAASVSTRGVTGDAIWCGLALALYYLGIHSLTPGKEGGLAAYWPILPLVSPMALAMALNGSGYRESALLLSAVVGLWTIYELRRTFWEPSAGPGRTRSGLQAGLVFVDWLAVPFAPRWLSLIFIGLFFTALSFRRIPSYPASERASATFR